VTVNMFRDFQMFRTGNMGLQRRKTPLKRQFSLGSQKNIVIFWSLGLCRLFLHATKFSNVFGSRCFFGYTGNRFFLGLSAQIQYVINTSKDMS